MPSHHATLMHDTILGMVTAPMNISEQDDATLIEWIQQGGYEAFAEIVRRHTTRFYRIAYRLLFRKEDAEDVVQEAFLRLWERPHMWNRNNKTKFTTWFYKVVTNMCFDMNRKKEMSPLTENLQLRDNGNAPDTSMEKAQERALLDFFISRLPERQQLALNLCFYEGLSNKEAADIIGVNLKALQSLLMRAKTSLKDKVAQLEKGISHVNERA